MHICVRKRYAGIQRISRHDENDFGRNDAVGKVEKGAHASRHVESFQGSVILNLCGDDSVIDIAVVCVHCWFLHGLTPAYLPADLQSIKDLPSRQRLRSWSSDTLAVPTSNLSTVSDRAFPIAAARVWDTLLSDVRSSSSLVTFQASAQDQALLTKLS